MSVIIKKIVSLFQRWEQFEFFNGKDNIHVYVKRSKLLYFLSMNRGNMSIDKFLDSANSNDFRDIIYSTLIAEEDYNTHIVDYY